MFLIDAGNRREECKVLQAYTPFHHHKHHHRRYGRIVGFPNCRIRLILFNQVNMLLEV